MLTFRPAQFQDLNQLVAIAARAFASYPLYTVPFQHAFKSDAKYQRFLTTLQKIQMTAYLKRHQGVVAIHDGQIVGAAFANQATEEFSLFDYLNAGGWHLLRYAFTTPLIRFLQQVAIAEALPDDVAKPTTAYLGLLLVDPNQQGLGIGTQLLSQWLMPHLKANQFKQLTLITNTAANVHFYQHRGFAISDRQTLTFANGTVPNWQLTLPL